MQVLKAYLASVARGERAFMDINGHTGLTVGDPNLSGRAEPVLQAERRAAPTSPSAPRSWARPSTR